MRRKNTANPDQLNLLDYLAKVNQLIQETDNDPDYQRYKRIFEDLSREYDHAESPKKPHP